MASRPVDAELLTLAGCSENRCAPFGTTSGISQTPDFMCEAGSIEAALSALFAGNLDGSRFIAATPSATTLSALGALDCAVGYGAAAGSSVPAVVECGLQCGLPDGQFSAAGCAPQDGCVDAPDSHPGAGPGWGNSVCAIIVNQFITEDPNHGNLGPHFMNFTATDRPATIAAFRTVCEDTESCWWVKDASAAGITGPKFSPEPTAPTCVLAAQCGAAQAEFGGSVLASVLANRRACVGRLGCHYCVEDPRLPLLAAGSQPPSAAQHCTCISH